MKKILFLAYPIDQMKPDKDTTFALIRGAIQNGHEAFLALPESLDTLNTESYARCSKINYNNTGSLSEETPARSSLNDFDDIWVRMDPPVDRAYFYSSLQLDFCKARVLNAPSALRDFNEKMAAMLFSQYGVDTLISSNKSSIENFIDKHPRVTLKPLDGFGGRGITFTDKEDIEQLNKIKKITNNYSKKIVAQKYIPEAKDGDVRCLIWNGKVIGSILRVHAEGHEINNMDAGGKAVAHQLTPKQQQIAEEVASFLLKQNVYFSGIDFLGDYLTEVNITSPTGIQELSRFSGTDWAIEIMK